MDPWESFVVLLVHNDLLMRLFMIDAMCGGPGNGGSSGDVWIVRLAFPPITIYGIQKCEDWMVPSLVVSQTKFVAYSVHSHLFYRPLYLW